jgi:hypothetical protein
MPSKTKKSSARQNVIAERQLVDEHGHKIQVTMELPERVSDIEWRCGVRITPDGTLRYGRGNDHISKKTRSDDRVRDS